VRREGERRRREEESQARFSPIMPGLCSMGDVRWMFCWGDFSSAGAVWIGVWGRCSAREGAWSPESEEAGTDTRTHHVLLGQVMSALACC